MDDKACPDETEDKMKKVILAQNGVQRVDMLKTRLFGSKIYVDVEISMDGSKPLVETHQTSEEVHSAIEREFPEVKHCMVHTNPM